MKKIEFIESYRIPDDGGDYQWDDNHGRLIRCKDCKWWGRKDIYKDGTEMIVCKKGRSVIPEGFCHHAELRGKQDEPEK